MSAADLKSFIGHLQGLVDSGQTEEVRRLLGSYDSALNDPELYDLLRILYPGYEFVRMGGKTYSCVIWQAKERQSLPENIDSVLRPSRPVSKPDGDWEEFSEFQDLMVSLIDKEARRDEEKARDDPKFALRSFSMKGEDLEIETYETTYFPMLRTCEYLKLELLRSWTENREELRQASSIGDVNQCLQYFPYRKRLHREGIDLLVDGRFRAACVTVGTLLCYQRPRESFLSYILIKRARRAVVGASRGYSVIPGGEFEPNERSGERRYSVKHNVLREYAEELFALQPAASYLELPAVQDLLTMLDSGLSSLHFTGVTVDLMTLRPCLCTALFIRDPMWWSVPKKYNFEFDTQDFLASFWGKLENPGHAIAEFPLDAIESTTQLAGIVYLGLRLDARLPVRMLSAAETSTVVPGSGRDYLESRAEAVVYLVWRTTGGLGKSGLCSESQLAAYEREKKEKVCVLEVRESVHRYQILVRGREKKVKAGSRLAKILWLVVVSLEDGFVLDEVASLLSGKSGLELEGSMNRAEQCIGLVRRFLGDKRKRLIRKTEFTGHYEVTFDVFWVCCDRDPCNSNLLRQRTNEGLGVREDVLKEARKILSKKTDAYTRGNPSE